MKTESEAILDKKLKDIPAKMTIDGNNMHSLVFVAYRPEESELIVILYIKFLLYNDKSSFWIFIGPELCDTIVQTHSPSHVHPKGFRGFFPRLCIKL